MSGNSNVEQLIAIRRRLKFSQQTMATQLGLSLRAYQALEGGESSVRSIHLLAAEQVALMNAILKDNPFLLSRMQREEVKELADMLNSPIQLFQTNSATAIQANNIDHAIELAKQINVSMAFFTAVGKTVQGSEIPD